MPNAASNPWWEYLAGMGLILLGLVVCRCGTLPLAIWVFNQCFGEVPPCDAADYLDYVTLVVAFSGVGAFLFLFGISSMRSNGTRGVKESKQDDQD